MQQAAQKLPFALLQWNQYAIPLQTLELHRLSWLNSSCKAFIKIYYFPKFHCHTLAPWKGTSCSISNYFLKILITTSFKRHVLWTIFRSLLKDTKITTIFPKRHICSTSCIEMNTLFAIFSNKRLGNFKVRPSHPILKRMEAG